MDLLRKYYVPLYQAPEPAGDTTPPPAVVPPADPSADPPAAADATPPQPEPSSDPPNVNPKSPKWALDRISSESAKRQEAERRAAEAERRAQEAEALASRLQQGKDTPPAAPRSTATTGTPTQEQINQAAAEQLFRRDVQEMNTSGLSAFGGTFNDRVNILAAVAPSQEEFFGMVADIISVDKAKAHEIINEIGADPERAALLASMPSRQRIAEITRMTMAAAAPKTDPKIPTPPPAPPAKVSKAPAPPPPVTPSASKEKDWRSDEASDEEFSRGWDDNMKNRRARR